jgi:aldehyde dehydrogenase family 7 protein A1
LDIYILPVVQIVHEKVYDEMLERLLKAYKQVKVGNAVEENTLCGPLHSKLSMTSFQQGMKKISAQVKIPLH